MTAPFHPSIDLTIVPFNDGGADIYQFSLRFQRNRAEFSEVKAKGRFVAIEVGQMDSLELVHEESGGEHTWLICVSNKDGVKFGELYGCESLTAVAIQEQDDDLQRVFTHAVIEARTEARFAAAAAVGGGVPSLPTTPHAEPRGWKKWVTFKRFAIGLCFLSACAIAYGVVFPNSTTKTESAAAVEGNDFSDVAAQVKAQIAAAAKSGTPAIDSLAGQNVTIETMRQMGLDPGKANAGCLVGVR